MLPNPLRVLDVQSRNTQLVFASLEAEIVSDSLDTHEMSKTRE